MFYSTASYDVLAKACAPFNNGSGAFATEMMVWSLVHGFAALSGDGNAVPDGTLIQTVSFAVPDGTLIQTVSFADLLAPLQLRDNNIPN